MKGPVRRFIIGIVIILMAASAGSASLFLQQNRNKTSRPLNPIDPGSDIYQGALMVDADGDGVPDFGITVAALTPTSARITFTNAQTNLITHMAIALDVEPSVWQPFTVSADITGSTGTHTVSVKVKTRNGKTSRTVTGIVRLEPAVYVSTSGDDSASGTIAFPMKTIQLAIGKAIAQGFSSVMVAQGEYIPFSVSIKGSVVITNSGLQLRGGWNQDFTAQTGYSILKAVAKRGIYVGGVTNVLIERFEIYNGKATSGNGGGIYLYGATNTTVTNVSIHECSAIHGAGAAIERSSWVYFHGEVFANEASSYGGGLYIMDNSTINNGSCKYYGSIYGNAAVMGGGIYGNLSSGEVYASVFGNSAGTLGGGVYVTDMDMYTHYTGDIYQNAAVYGGGIYIPQVMIAGPIIFGRIYENIASVSGGGVYVSNMGNVYFEGAIVSNSAASNGGGIYLDSTWGTIKGAVDGNQVTATVTSNIGGGIYFRTASGGASLTINGTVNSNYGAAVKGAGIYLDASGCTLTASMIAYNKSTISADGGGGLFVAGSNNTINNIIAAHNRHQGGDNIYVQGENNTFNNVQSLYADGVFADTSVAVVGNNNTFSACTVMSNTRNGIELSGSNSYFSGIAAYNGSNGITCANDSTRLYNPIVISNASIYNNAYYGILLNGYMSGGVAGGLSYNGPILILDSFITNNYGKAAVFLSIQSNVAFTNNVFGCSGTNGTMALDEYNETNSDHSFNTVYHTLVNNTFITNRMQFLYRNWNGSSTNVIGDIANLTTGNTGAITVSGNTAITN